VVRSSVICLPTPRCVVPLDEGCTQPLPSDPKIKLEYHGSFLYHNIPFVRNLHKLESLTPYTNDHNQNWSKGGSKNTHTRAQSLNNTQESKEKSATTKQQSYDSNMRSNLSLIAERCGHGVSELQCALRMLSVMVEAPKDLFYSLKGPREP
jgi:hypothetical protein